MIREKIEATPRLSVSPARRKRIFEKHGNRCYYPGCEVTTGLEFEHIISLWMGGKDDDTNTAPMCAEHHRQKTAMDAKMRAKAKRIIKAQVEPKPPSRIKSRGFDKAVSRGFDGKVRPRKSKSRLTIADQSE